MTKTNTMILTDFEVVNDIMHTNTFLKVLFLETKTHHFLNPMKVMYFTQYCHVLCRAAKYMPKKLQILITSNEDC